MAPRRADPRPAGALPNFDNPETRELPRFGNPSGLRRRQDRLSSRPIRAPVRTCAAMLRRPTRSGPPGAPAPLPLTAAGTQRDRTARCARPRPAQRCARPHRRRPGPRPPSRPSQAPPETPAAAAAPRNPLVRIPDGTAGGGVAGTVSTARLTTRTAALLRRRTAVDEDAFAPLGGHAGAFLVLPAVEVTGGYDTNPARVAERRGSVVRDRVAGTARALRLAAPRGHRGLARQLYGLRQDAGARPAGCRRQGDRAPRRDAQHRADRRGHADRRHRQSGQPERAGGADALPDLHHARRHVRPHAALQPRRGHRQGHGRAHRISAIAIHRRHHAEQRRSRLQSLRRHAAHQLRPDAGAQALRRGRRRHARARSAVRQLRRAARLERLDPRKAARHSNSRASSPARSRSAGSSATTSTRHCRS